MNIIRTTLFLLIAGMMLSGCSSENTSTQATEQQALENIATPFARGAITLNISAEPGMNAWNEIANSCTVLVLQTQKASSLRKLLSNPAQIKNLFNGAGAEDDILKVDRYAAMPGQKTTLHIDRSENTRAVAIVAGYYPFPKKQHMAIINVPVTLSSTGWWSKKWSAELSPLVLDITLGSQSITQLKKNPSQQETRPQTDPQANQEPSDNEPAQGDK